MKSLFKGVTLKEGIIAAAVIALFVGTFSFFRINISNEMFIYIILFLLAMFIIVTIYMQKKVIVPAGCKLYKNEVDVFKRNLKVVSVNELGSDKSGKKLYSISIRKADENKYKMLYKKIVKS